MIMKVDLKMEEAEIKLPCSDDMEYIPLNFLNPLTGDMLLLLQHTLPPVYYFQCLFHKPSH